MLSGAHMVIYSTNVEADRAFFGEVLKLPSVDGGGGFLIYAVPRAELSVHEAQPGGRQELYLQCADVGALVGEMKKRGITCSAVQDQGWGLVTEITLPGGGSLGVYQPRHARPEWK